LRIIKNKKDVKEKKPGRKRKWRRRGGSYNPLFFGPVVSLGKEKEAPLGSVWSEDRGAFSSLIEGDWYNPDFFGVAESSSRNRSGLVMLGGECRCRPTASISYRKVTRARGPV